MEINRERVIKNFLQNLYGISDKEYQIRTWIKGAGPECQDFDEAIENFFWDGDLILKNYQDYGLTESQYQILKKFRDEFDAFVDKYYWPPEFIDTPEWARIMDLAKEVLSAFNYSEK